MLSVLVRVFLTDSLVRVIVAVVGPVAVRVVRVVRIVGGRP
jgi:hypothetical protein